MTVQLELPIGVQAIATKVAEREGVSIEALLAKAVETYLSEEEREHSLMLERLAQARGGESLSRSEMDARFEKMLQPR